MNAESLLQKFEAFLESIPLERYRAELEPIKTVEQDLPKELNPLPAIYAHYWKSIPENFPDYENFFQTWWTEHLPFLDVFIRKYFWGCSHQFVYLGFKARIYRTLISVLTQFHFAYLWLAYCQLPLEASAELDMKGIDAQIECEGTLVALQVKKETYRAEARERVRFAPKKLKAQLIIEIPYTIKRPEDFLKSLKRTKEREHSLKMFAFLAQNFQRWLHNGFVVFRPEYPRFIEEFVRKLIQQKREGIVEWDETLKYLMDRLGAQ